MKWQVAAWMTAVAAAGGIAVPLALLLVPPLGAAGGGNPALPKPAGDLAAATFAGGCFWCLEPPFDELAGVERTISGYTGGELERPTYEQVSSGRTGHLEAVRVEYDPNVVSYEALLEVFWRNIDPFDAGGQFCDRGAQYESAIFAHGADQERLAKASKQALEKRFERPIATEVTAAGPFYPAEAYHQDYYRDNPLRYRFYRFSCGRDQRLAKVWGGNADR